MVFHLINDIIKLKFIINFVLTQKNLNIFILFNEL